MPLPLPALPPLAHLDAAGPLYLGQDLVVSPPDAQQVLFALHLLKFHAHGVNGGANNVKGRTRVDIWTCSASISTTHCGR